MADAPWLTVEEEELVIANAPPRPDDSDPYAVVCRHLYRFPWLQPHFPGPAELLPYHADRYVRDIDARIQIQPNPTTQYLLNLGAHSLILRIYRYIRDMILILKNEPLRLSQPHLVGYDFFRHQNMSADGVSSPHAATKAYIRLCHAMVLGDHLCALINPDFVIPEGKFASSLIQNVPAIPYRYSLPDKRDPRLLTHIAAIVARAHEQPNDPLQPPQLSPNQPSPLVEAQAQVAAMTKTKELCRHLAGGPGGKENQQSKFTGIAAMGLLFDSFARYSEVRRNAFDFCHVSYIFVLLQGFRERSQTMVPRWLTSDQIKDVGYAKGSPIALAGVMGPAALLGSHHVTTSHNPPWWSYIEVCIHSSLLFFVTCLAY